ncbi:MAG: YqgE/AlgH family protein [Alphaproteobacteria bacterium]|nr:YqgE/AlgH family protein [Alphaproteobacteria bacterium]
MNFQSLTGKILIANPYRSFGDIYDKSIIYIASHQEDGAVGMIVNKCISKLGIKKLYRITDDEMNIGQDIEKNIFIGGPVDPDRSFVIHSTEYNKNIIFSEGASIAVSSNIHVIKDILKGSGPHQSSIILGYTGWGGGQLEHEIQNNYWFIQDADDCIIFNEDNSCKWISAIEKFGIDISYLSSEMGYS